MTIQAIFADGVFRPIEPVDLPEDCKVEFEPRIIDAEIVQDLDAIYAVLAKRFQFWRTRRGSATQ